MTVSLRIFIGPIRPRNFAFKICRMRFYVIKMMVMRNNSMGKNNYACNQSKKFACMLSFKFQSVRDLKCLFKSDHDKINKKRGTKLSLAIRIYPFYYQIHPFGRKTIGGIN